MFRLLAILSVLCSTTIVSSVSSQEVNSLGRRLPDDAAPLDRQKIRLFEIDGTYMEWFKTNWEKIQAAADFPVGMSSAVRKK